MPAVFRITPDNRRAAKGEKFVEDANKKNTLQFAAFYAPRSQRNNLWMALDALEAQLETLEVGDRLAENWACSVLEIRVERML